MPNKGVAILVPNAKKGLRRWFDDEAATTNAHPDSVPDQCHVGTLYRKVIICLVTMSMFRQRGERFIYVKQLSVGNHYLFDMVPNYLQSET